MSRRSRRHRPIEPDGRGDPADTGMCTRPPPGRTRPDRNHPSDLVAEAQIRFGRAARTAQPYCANATATGGTAELDDPSKTQLTRAFALARLVSEDRVPRYLHGPPRCRRRWNSRFSYDRYVGRSAGTPLARTASTNLGTDLARCSSSSSKVTGGFFFTAACRPSAPTTASGSRSS